MSLSPKQERFVEEYLIDLNATQAAIRAGYSPRTADVQGPRLLGNVGVSAAIQALKIARSNATGITAERVINELARLAFLDIRGFYHPNGRLKFPSELNDDQAAALAQIESFEEFDGHGENRVKTGDVRKIRFWDKIAALKLVAQHLGMLVEKHEHSGPDGKPIESKVTHAEDDPIASRIAALTAAFVGAANRESQGAVPGDGAGESLDPGVDQGGPVPQAG